jgi:hypothetical protein
MTTNTLPSNAKEFNVVREGVKCLVALAIVSALVYGLYALREPLGNAIAAGFEWLTTILANAFKAEAFVNVMNAISSVFNSVAGVLNSAPLGVKIAVLLVGLWSTCIGIKIYNSGQKTDIANKLRSVSWWMVWLQMSFTIAAMMAFKPGSAPQEFFSILAMFAVQIIAAGGMDDRRDAAKKANEREQEMPVTSEQGA